MTERDPLGKAAARSRSEVLTGSARRTLKKTKREPSHKARHRALERAVFRIFSSEPL